MSDLVPADYAGLLTDIKQRVRQGQYAALKAVNKELIGLYWDIGRLLAERQEQASWGTAVVEQLAADLRREFPDIRGLSSRNIWRMLGLYQAYARSEKLPPLVAEIGWTHNLIILEKCKDDLEREFYIRMTRKMGWSKNVLIHQIENRTYEKTVRSQTSFDRTVPEAIRNQAKLAVKDEYTFDFLELADEHSERELERALLTRVDAFLREMGGAFTFVGSQYRLQVGDRDYYIDVLLYHRALRLLLAIDLKVGEFEPEHLGKMQFYLTVLDDRVRLPGENPSIGIILCKGKDRTVVEYALRDASKPVGVAAYQIVTQLPQDLQDQLPAPEQIAKLLAGIEA